MQRAKNCQHREPDEHYRPEDLTYERCSKLLKKKKTVNIPNTIHTIVEVGICLSTGNICKPSIADVMVMGGVIIPSAINAAPPIIAGKPATFFAALQARTGQMFHLHRGYRPLRSASRI